jgi:tetratricopeptide (TPR) repeat protein
MTERQRQLLRRRSSTRQFLFSKTDPKIKSETGATASQTISDPLLRAYPQIQEGRSLIQSALTALDSFPKFSVMVIRTDSFHTDNPTENSQMAQCLLAVAETIESVCQRANGLWGRLETTVFGCFFPGKTNFFCLKTAKQIHKKLAAACGETVSIGISAYPTISYTKSQIIENAYKALDHAAFFGPGSTVCFDAVSLNISGDKLYHEGDLNGAIEEFKLALLLDPKNVNIHNSLGVCYGVQGNYEKALDAFKTAIQMDSGEVMAVYNAGLVHMLAGRQEKALERFLAAAKISEDVFEIMFQTGRLYLDMGNPKQAEYYLEKAASLEPTSGAVFRYLGDCSLAMEMPDKAADAYRKAVKLNPNDAAALSSLGYLFDIMGENAEIAIAFCRQSIQIAPENGLFRHRLGALYFKQKAYETALKEFKKAYELGHDSTHDIEKTQNRLTTDAS